MHGEADTSPSDRRRFWFVTQNADKYREARRTLSPFGIRIRMLTRPKTEIQSKNLEEIAKFAAEDAAKKYHRTVVVEDSGLFVRKLNGFPGPFSSYVYATVGCEGLLQLMNRGEDRDAYFQASLAVATPRRLERTFTGKTYGTVSRRALGTSGFGFDPIFVPKGTRRTFAQGGVKFKDRYSHRAEAFRQLAVWSAKTDI